MKITVRVYFTIPVVLNTNSKCVSMNTFFISCYEKACFALSPSVIHPPPPCFDMSSLTSMIYYAKLSMLK